jgi:acylphosphatase
VPCGLDLRDGTAARDDLLMIRRRLLVSGRVQGVWFRDSCRAEAEAQGVAGWARNLVDGRVEVVLEGDEEAVSLVEAWCHRGPRRAEVVSVEGFDEDASGERGFVIA